MANRTSRGKRKDARAPVETSAERFRRRYPNGAPFGAPAETGVWRHTLVTLALALLAALTITTSLAIMYPEPEGVTFTQCGSDSECAAFEAAGYAPFTSDGFPCQEDEALMYVPPEAGTSPDGIACVHRDMIAIYDGASATVSDAAVPSATPCGPVTLPGCRSRPTPVPADK